jgi:hypothetical protein
MSNPPGPPLPLDYNSLPRPPRYWYPLSVVASIYPAGGIILIILGWITPHFRQVFHDFNTDLPFSTMLLLGLSRAMIDYYLWIAWTAIILLLPLAIALARKGQPMTPKSTRLIRLLTLIPCLLFIVWSVVSLYLPMLDMLEAVGGKH